MRRISINERSGVPSLSILLGYAPMLPFIIGAGAAWVTKSEVRELVAMFTTFWAGSILIFLAGVRRGLSFRTEGGPTYTQIMTMLILFIIGLLALLLAAQKMTSLALGPLIVGFCLILVLDPIAARNGEAPLFFARLRPLQIPIAIVSLAIMMAALLR